MPRITLIGNPVPDGRLKPAADFTLAVYPVRIFPLPRDTSPQQPKGVPADHLIRWGRTSSQPTLLRKRSQLSANPVRDLNLPILRRFGKTRLPLCQQASGPNIRAQEEIPNGPPHSVGNPPLHQMIRQVAPLAEAFQVPRRFALAVMVQMRCRQDHPGAAELIEIGPRGASQGLPRPSRYRLSVMSNQRSPRHAEHLRPVRSRTDLAAALRPTEADKLTELGPVDRIEPSRAGADRHLRLS